MPQGIFERAKIAVGERTFSAFGGLTFRKWLQVVRENHWSIPWRFWPRAMMLTAASLGNSLSAWIEDRRFAKQIEAVRIQPPLFILGHWRSGTTHLHNLLSVDDRFAVPNFYQVVYPHGFLASERLNKPWLGVFLPKERQIDRVTHGFDMPAEDEFAIANQCTLSCYISWMFPRRIDHYDRYLTLRDVPAEEIAVWKSALEQFLKRLTVRHHGKMLVLKSPPHTCRIKLLLEMFPEARFIHIHRHPFEIFPSTKKMTETIVRWAQLQPFNHSILEDRIIRQYKEMYEAYFEQRSLIPEGRLFELSFDQLKREPLETLKQIYTSLNLPDFEVAEPKIRKYLASIADYKQSGHKPIDPRLANRLATEWHRAFAEFGYDPTPAQ